MKRETGTLSRSFILALLVHVFFVAMLLVSFEWTPTSSFSSSHGNVVKAVAVDEKKVQEEMAKLDQAKRHKEAERQQQLKRLQEKLAQEQRRLQQVQDKRRAAEQRAKTEARRKAEKQRSVAEARKKEQERLADLKRKRVQEAERLKQLQAQKQAMEEKRKEEEQRLAKIKAERERERKRKEEQERRRKAAEKALQEQLAEEQAQRQAQQDRSTVKKYMELIRQKVNRNWVRPAGWKKGQTCKVDIQLIPGGDVADVQIMDSCGSPLADQSVQTAVSRAAPLPLPPDGSLFDRFREITFIFNPKE